ncbi:uncharacterized protein PAC_00584 [Phialocephala subalpina]|uniref:Uncharacterized protein n=1 Tax=Phialocephala subalpina TaxID=576137 RepID=A0A1L7WD52_9HELO|nr:uncharacterized protein PAC_00584 [Phialocephala subalpina]
MMDRIRRRKYALDNGGVIPQRFCPKAMEYREHQVSNSALPEGSNNGLYLRIMLEDFLTDFLGKAPFQPGPTIYTPEKIWPSSPIVALYKATTLLHGLNLSRVLEDLRWQLKKLQDIYSKPIDLLAPEPEFEWGGAKITIDDPIGEGGAGERVMGEGNGVGQTSNKMPVENVERRGGQSGIDGDSGIDVSLGTR